MILSLWRENVLLLYNKFVRIQTSKTESSAVLSTQRKGEETTSNTIFNVQSLCTWWQFCMFLSNFTHSHAQWHIDAAHFRTRHYDLISFSNTWEKCYAFVNRIQRRQDRGLVVAWGSQSFIFLPRIIQCNG